MTYVVRCQNSECGSVLFVTESWEVAVDGMTWDCMTCSQPAPQMIDVEHVRGAA